jgi:hypothetical protein
MKKALIVAAAILIPASAALADWAGNFKTLDTDGNGRISRTEYEANVAKLKLDPAPTFTAMDADVNNGVDEEGGLRRKRWRRPSPCRASLPANPGARSSTKPVSRHYDLPRNPAGNFRVSSDAAVALF